MPRRVSVTDELQFHACYSENGKYHSLVCLSEADQASLPLELATLACLTGGVFSTAAQAAAASDRILHKLGREGNGLLSAEEKAKLDATSWEALMAQLQAQSEVQPLGDLLDCGGDFMAWQGLDQAGPVTDIGGVGLGPGGEAGHGDAAYAGFEVAEQGGNKTSKFIGVNWHSKDEVWRARIRLKNHKRIELGSFATEEEAARVYDAAAYHVNGSKAKLNLLHEPPPPSQELLSRLKGTYVPYSTHRRAKVAAANSKSVRATSAYRGVDWNQKDHRWCCRITAKASKGSRYIFLGNYTTEEEAARVFDQASHYMYGREAFLNFPGEEPAQPTSQLLNRISSGSHAKKKHRGGTSRRAGSSTTCDSSYSLESDSEGVDGGDGGDGGVEQQMQWQQTGSVAVPSQQVQQHQHLRLHQLHQHQHQHPDHHQWQQTEALLMMLAEAADTAEHQSSQIQPQRGAKDVKLALMDVNAIWQAGMLQAGGTPGRGPATLHVKERMEARMMNSPVLHPQFEPSTRSG